MQYLAFIVGILVGTVIGAVGWDLMVTAPKSRKHHKRQQRMMDRIDTWHRAWLADIEVDPEPGVRIVNGKRMYSSEWLQDYC